MISKVPDLILYSLLLAGQASQSVEPLDYVCPMDPDVRSAVSGKCPRCGMALTLGVPDPVEYGIQVKTHPRRVRAGQPMELSFSVTDPSGKPVVDFGIVHEKLFHLFIVSEDLNFFLHEHPELAEDRSFRFTTRLPKP